MKRGLLAALLVLPLLGSDSPKEYDDKVEVAGIEGTWQMVDISDAGQKREPGVERCIQIFRGGKWSYSEAGRPSTAGTYTTDKTRVPAFLDESYGTSLEEARKYIYRIEGDTLRTAFRNANEGERPTSFDEPRLYIMTWKRLAK